MKIIDLLWIMVWSGIYSNIENLQSLGLSSGVFGIIQGMRCVLPLFALCFCLLKALASKHRRIPFFSSPLELLFYYALVAIITAGLSPEPLVSLYWGGLYLSPIMVIWYAMNSNKPLENIRRIMIMNYIIFATLVLSFMPVVFRGGISGWNTLPFSLGEVNRNGVARYALIVMIFSLVRFINQKKSSRHFYLFLLLFALYLLIQTQSRSALLGLAVVTVLIFYLKGLNWRFLLFGPAFTYIIWIVGFKTRAEGELDKLVSLTGREDTWQRGIEQISASPFFGWGFQADRLLLEFEHMHNSYLHVAIQSGILGLLFFTGAIIGTWKLILRNKFFKEKIDLEGVDKFMIAESIAIVAFLTVRSFFESTAAFYGIDELVLVTHICYLQLVAKLYVTPKG